ncbi:MAG: hypothetical protein KKC54_07850 [Nanoarchaeota archaeon]|nr:hypothetical protein [Nanoarchaeota archaeon]
MKIRDVIKRSAFMNSFKLDKRFLYVLFMDMLLLLIIILMVPSYTFLLRLNLDSLKEFDDSAKRIEGLMMGKNKLDQQIKEDIKLAVPALKFFFIKIAVITLLFLAILLLSVGFIKGKVWSEVTNEKISAKVCLKFSLFILIWNLIWILLFLIIVFGLKLSMETINKVVLLEMLFFLCFSSIMPPIFFKTKKILTAVKETFIIGVTRFYPLILSYMIIVLVFIILSIIASSILLISRVLAVIYIILALLIYMSWIKVYMNKAIEQLY